MRQITFILFASLCMALQTSAATVSIDYKKAASFNDMFDFSNNCTKPGLLCKNCNELVNCIKIGAEFDEVLIETCSSAGQTCMIDHCSSDPNPQCGDSTAFTCHNTGVFPDPFSCHYYHVCVEEQHNLDEDDTTTPIPTTTPPTPSDPPGEGFSDEQREIQNNGMLHIPVKCDDGYGYNPVTTYCSLQLNNNVCPEPPPVPVCKLAGQNGAITTTSIYYICTKKGADYVPELYMCPHGTKYDKGECVKKNMTVLFDL